MTLGSCDATGISVSIIGYKQHCQWYHCISQNLSCETTGTSIGITWCWWYCQWSHYIPYFLTIKMGFNMTFMVIPLVPVSDDENYIIKGITAFLGQNEHKQLVLASSDAIGVINWNITFLRSRPSKLGATWPFWKKWCHWDQHHMISMALSMTHDTDDSTNTDKKL